MTRFVKWFGLAGLILATTATAADDVTFQLTSSAAPVDGLIPKMYTCDGNSISPPLVWSGAPAATQTFALIMRDPDASSGTFYHWVWYDIPKTVTLLPDDAAAPHGTLIGVNSKNTHGYTPPCPPPGHTHHYIFDVYALSGKMGVGAGADAGTVMGAMQAHLLGKAEYVMTYKR